MIKFYDNGQRCKITSIELKHEVPGRCMLKWVFSGETPSRLTHCKLGQRQCKHCENCEANLDELWINAFNDGLNKTEQSDSVNHPSHYETGQFECIEVMLETQGVEAVKGFCKCNAFKYLYRANRKNGVEDYKKAVWYLNKLIELDGKED